MKKIIIFRHGKSDWNADHETDHERVLATRGVKAAGAMGRWLSSIGEHPEFLVSSTAVRAHTTINLAREAGAWKPEVVATKRLYEGSVEEYLAVIRETPENASRVLLAGHEPTCSMTTSRLIGGGVVRFPTAAMVRIDVNVASWSDVNVGMGMLIWFMAPRFLPGQEF